MKSQGPTTPEISKPIRALVLSALCCVFLVFVEPVHAQQVDVQLGEPKALKNPGVEYFQHMPDGHTSLWRDEEKVWMILPGTTSYLVSGESLMNVGNAKAVIGKGGRGEIDNGGAWIYGVGKPFTEKKKLQPKDSDSAKSNSPNLSKGNASADGDVLLGFIHAEDHEFESDPSSSFVAWKTVALAISKDKGKSWEKQGAIISSARRKPRRPTWGGAGDFCTVRDEKNKRWVCIYAEHFLHVAVSEDAMARPGTWKKYYQGRFSQPGLGGRQTPIKSLMSTPGGNPSVHFNRDLEKWVMAWHSWDTHPKAGASIWLSVSDDLVEWESPKLILQGVGGQAVRYPTITGNSDQLVEDGGWLHYALYDDFKVHDRQYLIRPIRLRWKK